MSGPEKPELRPANENPWYCLATIHGEQPIDRIDRELAEKNCAFWRRWIDLDPNDHQARVEIESSFAKRTTSLSLPDPAEPADFSRTRFDRPMDFGSFPFRRPIDFSSTLFSQMANFRGAHFYGNSDFSYVTFSETTDFSRAQFSGSGANFQGATFSGHVLFGYARLVNSNFIAAKFGKGVDFNSSTFTVQASFTAAIFADFAYFRSSVFDCEANFNSTTFTSRVDFGSVAFSDRVSFFRTNFFKEILFVNTKFGGHTTFANARFETHVADFRGAMMHQATEWHGVVWPKPPKNKDDAQQQVYAYERLKQEMEQLKKHDDEQRFFRRELRARRGLVSPLSGKWLLNLAYDASSFYGNSVSRPLYWLLVVFAAGAAIFARAPIHCGAPMPLRLAIKLSFANMFVFLPDKREIMTPEMISCLSDTTRAVSALQSVSGVVLLFLLGLALRNRFRMK